MNQEAHTLHPNDAGSQNTFKLFLLFIPLWMGMLVRLDY